MRGFLARVGAAYQMLASVALPALLAGAAGLWLARPDPLRAAWQAFREPPPRVTPGDIQRFEKDRALFDERVREYEASRARREAEVSRLELIARSSLARAEAERRQAEEVREAAREAEKGRPEFESNVELLSRAEPATALAMMRSWTDEAVAAHVRAMRPTRAAQVADAMRADPAWQERLARILEAGPGR